MTHPSFGVSSFATATRRPCPMWHLAVVHTLTHYLRFTIVGEYAELSSGWQAPSRIRAV